VDKLPGAEIGVAVRKDARPLRQLQRQYRKELKGLPDVEGPADRAKREELEKKYEKQLQTLLGKGRERFRQVVLQQLESRPEWSETVWDVTEVVRGLKLSDEQREKLKEGKASAKVLDKGQQERWLAMKGKPVPGLAPPVEWPAPPPPVEFPLNLPPVE